MLSCWLKNTVLKLRNHTYSFVCCHALLGLLCVAMHCWVWYVHDKTRCTLSTAFYSSGSMLVPRHILTKAKFAYNLILPGAEHITNLVINILL